jgi:hypothetical protein
VLQVVENTGQISWLGEWDSNYAARPGASIAFNQLVGAFELVKIRATSLRSWSSAKAVSP